jgi:chromosome segregation ATPase
MDAPSASPGVKGVTPLKGKIGLTNLFSVLAGVGIIGLSIVSHHDKLRGWATAHAMGWVVWVTDLSAICVAGLIRLAGIYYLQNEVAQEEYQEQLERTLTQAQQLEQENEALCDQLEELETQINQLEARGGYTPALLLEARAQAERLQLENAELKASVEALTKTNTEMESRLLQFEARFLETDTQLSKALSRIGELERSAISVNPLGENAATPRSLHTALSLVQQLEMENAELSVQVKTMEEQSNETYANLHRSMLELKEQNRDLQQQLEQVQQPEAPTAPAPTAPVFSEKMVEVLLHEIESVLTKLPQKIEEQSTQEEPTTLRMFTEELAEEPALALVSVGDGEPVEEDIYLMQESWQKPLRPIVRRVGGGRGRRAVRR